MLACCQAHGLCCLVLSAKHHCLCARDSPCVCYKAAPLPKFKPPTQTMPAAQTFCLLPLPHAAMAGRTPSHRLLHPAGQAAEARGGSGNGCLSHD